jgi:hypothetical protein
MDGNGGWLRESDPTSGTEPPAAAPPFARGRRRHGRKQRREFRTEIKTSGHKNGKEIRKKPAANKNKNCEEMIACSSIKKDKAKIKEATIQRVPLRRSCRRSLAPRSLVRAFCCPR